MRAGVVSVANGSAQLLERCAMRARVAAPVISPAETKGLRGAGARLGLTKLRSVVSYVKTASHGCLLCLLFLRLCRLRLSAMRTLS